MPPSLIPNPPTRAPRPPYLVACLLLASLLGLGGLTNGCSTLQFYRQTTQPSVPWYQWLDVESRARIEQAQKAQRDALIAFSRRIVPLATANALLSFLLVLASAVALAGRPHSNSLALQATLANLAYATIDYVLERPLRAMVIEAATQPPLGAAALAERIPSAAAFWWMYRCVFAVHILMLAVIAWALTRPQVVALYSQDEEVDQD